MGVDQGPDSILSPFFHTFSLQCEVLIGLFSSSKEYCIHPHNRCLQKVVRNFFFLAWGEQAENLMPFWFYFVFLWVRLYNSLSVSLSLISGALFHLSSDILEVLDFLVGTSGPCGLLLQAERPRWCMMPSFATEFLATRGKVRVWMRDHIDSCPLPTDGIVFDFIQFKVIRSLPGLPHSILSHPNSAHPLPFHLYILQVSFHLCGYKFYFVYWAVGRQDMLLAVPRHTGISKSQAAPYKTDLGNLSSYLQFYPLQVLPGLPLRGTLSTSLPLRHCENEEGWHLGLWPILIFTKLQSVSITRHIELPHYTSVQLTSVLVEWTITCVASDKTLPPSGFQFFIPAD